MICHKQWLAEIEISRVVSSPQGGLSLRWRGDGQDHSLVPVWDLGRGAKGQAKRRSGRTSKEAGLTVSARGASRDANAGEAKHRSIYIQHVRLRWSLFMHSLLPKVSAEALTTIRYTPVTLGTARNQRNLSCVVLHSTFYVHNQPP